MQNQKRIRSCRKYNYSNQIICDELDVIYRKCNCCGEYFPRTNEYFRKDKQNNKISLTAFCKNCISKKEREREAMLKQFEEEMIEIAEQPITYTERSLFEDEEQAETVESKVNRILDFLGLNRGTRKK